MIRTANPALSDKTFEKYAFGRTPAESMTVSGTVNKTFILLFLLVMSASVTWGMIFRGGNAQTAQLLTIGGAIGGLIFALVTVFKQQWAPVTSPIYALLEGLFLGGISAFFEARFPGIVIQAVALTFGTLFALLTAYRMELIKATENFKLGVAAATGGIFVIYLVTMVLGFFNINIPFIHESGLLGIGFSLFVVVVAALNLVLDFDFIEHGAERGAPKHMEWYGAFGLIVTLVWLYLEILRLLAKLNSRR